MPIIYKITNMINNKSYIGQTKTTLQKRWSKHCYTSFTSKKNIKFHNAIKKYGTECWNLEILEETNELNEREIYWISHYDTFNSGYNSTIGGRQGSSVSEETKTKMRKPKPVGFGEKISKVQKGIKKSKEHNEKNSKSHIGKIPWNKNIKNPYSEEVLLKMKHPRSEHFRKQLSIDRQGEGNPFFNKKWITNGVVTKAINSSDDIPEGFWEGRTQNKIWVNNGSYNKLIDYDQSDFYASKGFKRGMLK